MPVLFRPLSLVTSALVAGCALLPSSLGAQYPAQQQPYPPQQQQYPPQQYPPQQQPYPQQGQYPPPQGQQPYPQQGQYPPPQGQPYPAGQYPPNGYPPQGPLLPPQQLDSLVSRIALYPDGLLAQVLTASTYWNELQDAAGWANQHNGMRSDQLAQAIAEDRLPFDASVAALLPFPSVLNQMVQDMPSTQQLGSAVLGQRNDVMDAVQRMRQQAYQYGYLQNNQYERVALSGPGSIEIDPVAPGAYYVPVYDPLIVYRRPRPGFFVGGAIRFGPAITIGAGFAPYGWASPGFGWRDHTILIDRRPWVRTWNNRQSFVSPYPAAARPRFEGPRVEHHDFQDRGRRDGREHEGHDHH